MGGSRGNENMSVPVRSHTPTQIRETYHSQIRHTHAIGTGFRPVQISSVHNQRQTDNVYP